MAFFCLARPCSSVLLVVTCLVTHVEGVLGVVEGFNWPTADAVRGQSGQYNHSQRQSLLGYMGTLAEGRPENLSVYVYAPQTVDTMKVWDAAQLCEWTATRKIADSHRITLVLGLRPGFIDSLETTQQLVNNRTAQFLQAGIHEIVLAWDDAPGAGTLQQLARQRDLVNTISAESGAPQVHIWGVVPPAYYGDADVQVPANMTTSWANKLAITQQMPLSVRFLLCGQQINPRRFSISQWPHLNGTRELIFWDNDAAVDTSTRLPWGLPSDRDPLLFSEQRYVLNLAFPPERVIHQVNAILLTEGNASNVKIVAESWISYLVKFGFVSFSARKQVQSDLAAAITADERFDSISALVATYPSFRGVWD